MSSVNSMPEQILDAIVEYTQTHGYAPTIRELCGIVGIKSPSTMHNYLERLRRTGVITWEPSSPRTIRVLRKDFVNVR